MWLRRPIRTDSFVEGLEAIDWTVEERGLAGLSQMGGTLKVGRRRERGSG